jgi:hypothetical protein
MKLRFLASFAMISSLASVFACSAGGDGTGSKTSGSDGSGASSSTGATSSTGAQPSLDPNGAQPNLGGSVGTGPLPMDPNDPRNVPVRPKICDAAGNCTCLRLALVGTLESAATSTDTKPFVDWLNGNSEGSATVTMVATKPTIDEAFLNMYDILVVANVNGWTFSADEKAAVEKWVKEMGGGIVTLTGFTSQAAEPAATSQLVDFAGMGYTGAGEADWTAPTAGGTTPIYYHGGAQDLRNCLNLWSMEQDKQAAITTAIKFSPQTGPLEKLTSSLDYVGAFIGWPVKAPAGSTVIATDPASGKSIAVAYEIDGKGRILSFGDEWVIFTNQWQPVGNFTDVRMDASNMCWQAPAGTDPGFFHSVKSLYQTKQFWYNAINWVAPPSECNFTIRDDDVVVK